jgi:hypothetical protein
MTKLLAIILCAISFGLLAQREVDEQADWKDRIYFGGGGGLNGGTDLNGNRYFFFSLSPVVGYMITSQLSAGTGIVYQRTNFSDRNISFTQYGIMPFVRYNFKDLFLTAEYNYINLPRLGNNLNTVDRIFLDRLLLGVGYSQPLGGRTKLNVMAMYDVLFERSSPFLTPWVFRVFFTF